MVFYVLSLRCTEIRSTSAWNNDVQSKEFARCLAMAFLEALKMFYSDGTPASMHCSHRDVLFCHVIYKYSRNNVLFQCTGWREETARMGFNLAKFLTMRTSFSGQFLVDSLGKLTGTFKAIFHIF